MASMRTIGVRLRLLVGDYKKDAQEAGKATDDLSSKITKAGAKNQADLDRIALAAGAVGVALLAASGAAVVATAKFDKQMSEVAAVSGATAGELDRLRQAALDAGAATVFSASEAAQAQAELAKAGISTADILGGALTGSLSLASAGSLDLARSAEIASAAMNTFGLEGEDVSHIADVLAAASNKSAASVESLGLGLQQVGLVAAQNNLTLEDTVGVLAALADRGLQGSDAGTSLKTALQRLAAPTGEAGKLMEQLGISMYDASGGMVDISTVAGQLEGALSDLAPAQRNAALQTIFGSDAIRAGNVLFAEGEAGIRNYIAAVNDEGAASEVAAKKLDNLAGDVEALTGSLETLAIGAGSGANDGLRVLTQTATGLVNAMAALPAPLQSALVILGGTTGAALLAAAGWLKLRGSVTEVADALSTTGTAGTRAGRGLQAITTWAGRGAAVFGVLATAGVILGQVFDEDLNPQIERLANDLAVFGDTGKLDGEALRVIGEDAGDLGRTLADTQDILSAFGVGMADFVLQGAGPTAEATERLKALDAALAHLVKSGRQDEAGEAFKRIWTEAQAMGVSLTDLQNKFPEYIAANLKATQANQELADSTGNVAREQLAATEAGQKLAELWEELNGVTKTADEQMLEAVEAAEAVGEAFKESAGELEGNSKAALENRLALQEAALQAYEAADAMLVNGAAAEDAKGELDLLKESAIASAVANGGNADEVRRLADQLFRLPERRSTTVTINYKLGAVPQGITGLAAFSQLRWGGVIEHAATGRLRDAAMFAAGSRPLYGFAEPETGGEAFVPKRGNYGRSMSILQQAAGWYGADVVPRRGDWYGGMTGGLNVNVTVTPKPGADRGLMREIVGGLRFDVTQVGAGSSQDYTGRRGPMG